jgi:hypothetical protein
VRSGRVSIRSFLQPKGASRGLRLFTWVCGFGRAQKAIWSPRSFRNNRSPNSGGWAALFRISSCKRVERASLKSINPGSFSSRRSDSAARASWKNQVLCDWERTTTAEGSSSRRSTFREQTSAKFTGFQATISILRIRGLTQRVARQRLHRENPWPVLN